VHLIRRGIFETRSILVSQLGLIINTIDVMQRRYINIIVHSNSQQNLTTNQFKTAIQMVVTLNKTINKYRLV